MSFLRKDKSWVNKVIFPAPKPSSYNANTFDAFGDSCRLCYIPRRQAAVRRPADSDHDPNSIPCLWFPQKGKGARCILIYCHGNSEDIGHSAFLLTRFRETLNVHVLAMEYPGYGMSPGTPSESAINNDLLVVYSFLTGVMKWPTKDIFLYGFSIGTGPTTHIAAHHPIGGLTLLAPYTSIRDMVVELFPKGVGRVAQYLISNRFDNVKEIKSVACDTLIIHGKKDELIPFAHSETLINKCGAAKKHLFAVESMKHCFEEDDIDFILIRMMEFFEFKGGERTCTFPPYVFKKPPPPVEDEKAKGDESKADAKPQSKPEDEWACLTCTFMNRGDSALCEMCLAPKSGGLTISQSASAPSASATAMSDADSKDVDVNADEEFDVPEVWSCETCTFLNVASQNQCDMCGSKKGMVTNLESVIESVFAARSGSVGNPPLVPHPPSNPPSADDQANSQDPSSSAPVQQPDASVQHLPWECPQCTYINEKRAPRCEVCFYFVAQPPQAPQVQN